MTHVLLIDDESATRLIMTNRLKEAGFEVVAAENGAQGLTLARERRFDVLVVDSGISSGVTSFEVCRRLKQMPNNAGVPLILCAKSSSREDVAKGYEAGADACMVKADLPMLEHVLKVFLRIKHKQDELLLQVAALTDNNRRLTDERQRATTHTEPHVNGSTDPAAVWRDVAPGKPDGVVIVDDEGIVRYADRGGREMFGGAPEGKNLGRLAPTSGLEAFARDVRTEKRDGLRFDIAPRNGRGARALQATVVPMCANPGENDPGLRVLLFLDISRRRVAQELIRTHEYIIPPREVGLLRDVARFAYCTANIIGPSFNMTAVRQQVTEAARSLAPILIVGEAGSGRQHIARALHFSGEGGGPFLTVECASLNAEHLDSELFGQVKGSTPEAIFDRPGVLQQAAHGTVFLRDIEQLPMPLQAKLARSLREHVAVRVGTEKPEPIDVRVIASTSVDLARVAQAGAFDSGLYQLIARSQIHVAPLRERRDDIHPLVMHFLRMYGSGRPEFEISSAAMARIEAYAWPGNVLELRSCIERACKHAVGGVIGVEQLPTVLREIHTEPIGELTPAPRPARIVTGGAHLPGHNGYAYATPSAVRSEPRPGEVGSEDPISLDHYEMKCLQRALDATQGDKLKAAKLLKVGKSTLYRKLKRYGIT